MAGLLLSVTHASEYRYSTRVDLAHHVAHLTPRAFEHQQVEQFALDIDPPPNDMASGPDVFGNVRSLFSIYGPHQRLRVQATSRVRLSDPCSGRPLGSGLAWETARDALRYRAGTAYTPVTEFVYASAFVPRAAELGRYALASFAPGRPLAQAAVELMHRIHADFRYLPASTEISTPVLETFRARAGVCQDFAHVMIGCLRSIGLSARYVSGYLVSEPGPQQDRTIGAHASHAWVSVHCPPRGWIDLDPTNDVIPAARHVTVALGRDYGDVVPLRGVIRGGGEHELSVAVQVLPCAPAEPGL